MPTSNSHRETDVRNEIELVTAAKLGDSSAFAELVNRCSALVFRIVRQILPCDEDAEDIVQDAFLSAFQHLQQFEERARFSTWVTRIGVHAALLRLQRAKRLPTVPIHDEEDTSNLIEEKVADWRPNPEQRFSNDELKLILRRALAALPEGYRIVFVLRDIECLSVADTAAIVGISTANVKVRLFRARLQLRHLLSKHFDCADRERSRHRPALPRRTLEPAAEAVNVEWEYSGRTGGELRTPMKLGLL